MCGFIYGFVWYFNLFTIYQNFNWIYVVSPYFESSAKLLKSSILRVLFLACDGRRRGDPNDIRQLWLAEPAPRITQHN